VSRIREWANVVRADVSTIPMRDIIRLSLAMAKAVVHRRSVGSVEWRRRMRKCHRCLLYDSDLKRCHIFDPDKGETLGCACYMPYKALCSHHGWATEALSSEDAERLGCW
jgi:hypothetical protein